MPLFDHPAPLCAVAAAAVRLTAGFSALSQNPLLSKRQLDSAYYVAWAREIGGGDLGSAHGIVAGSPFILNPLYAYVLAPVTAPFADPAIPVLVLHAVLAAATTALAVVAARRFFGLAAAWTAGIAVAFSTALVQLDTHVAVSGLAAFLTAGAVFASAPPREGGSGRGHGPVAAGLWLGIGALARPITPMALPFFAWNEWKRRSSRRLAGAAIVVATFAACALPSLVRNWAVTGEPIVYTSASGLNLEIGNNPLSRKFRTMVSPLTHFEPVEMHRDARDLVARELRREPTYSEVSTWFTGRAVEEFVRAPAASLAFCAQKARWFWSPAEVPSSASLATDLRFAPLLRLAFVPTWFVAAAALVGLIVHRRRRDVVCGPGAMFVAHVAVLTLVFPLSHYRSPAIPALAVLAGGSVHAAIEAWRAGARRTTWTIVTGVVAVVVAGALPPQPARLREADAMNLAISSRDSRKWDDAVAYVREAMDVFREDWPGEPEQARPWIVLGEIEAYRGHYADALTAFDRGLAIAPGNLFARLEMSRTARLSGDFPRAELAARRVVDAQPGFALAHAALGEALLMTRGAADARREFEIARDLDPHVQIDADALRRVGMPLR
jgi:tetratricopeptide (TPR) repeat protein